jgi:hypothetical protein
VNPIVITLIFCSILLWLHWKSPFWATASK